MDKHKNGYQPKIEYWKGKLNLAIESGNVGGVEYATKKVQYFMNRQAEVYGGGMHTLQEVGEFSPLLKEFFKNNYK